MKIRSSYRFPMTVIRSFDRLIKYSVTVLWNIRSIRWKRAYLLACSHMNMFDFDSLQTIIRLSYIYVYACTQPEAITFLCLCRRENSTKAS